MKTISIEVRDATTSLIIPIGRRGENNATEVIFDIQYLIDAYGDGNAMLMAKRTSDVAAYPVTVERDGTTVTWTTNNADTAFEGLGKCELFWYVDEVLAKSIVYTTITGPDIGDATGDPPDPYETWLETLTNLANETFENVYASEGYALGKQNGEDVGDQSPYYHNNSKYYAEQAEEIINSFQTDTTLSVSGKAADAKKTGDEIGELKTALSDFDVVYGKNYFNKNDLSDVNKYLTVSSTNIYNLSSGSNGYRMSNVIETSGAEDWYINYAAAGSTVMVFYAQANGTIISNTTLSKSSTAGQPTKFTTPANCALMRIRFIETASDVRSDYMIICKSADDVAPYDGYYDAKKALQFSFDFAKESANLKDKNLRFVVVSDIHYGSPVDTITSDEKVQYLIDKLNEINRETPFDFVIVNGDVCQYSATDENYTGFKAFVNKIPFPCFATVGNHDVFANNNWELLWGLKRAYSLETDDFYFAFCDSYYNKAIDPQTGEYAYEGLNFAKLEEELKKAVNLGKYPVIVTHQYDTAIDTDFNSLCIQYGVKIVVRGHTHSVSNEQNYATGSFILNPGCWLGSSYGLTIVYTGEEYIESENRQYDYTTDTYTSSTAHVFGISKAGSADYQLGRNTMNLQRLVDNIS